MTERGNCISRNEIDMKRFLCMGILGGMMALHAEIPDQIRPDHPRIFFNADSWPAVKARALGPEKARWEALLKEVETFPDDPVCSNTEGVQNKTVTTATGTHVLKTSGHLLIENVKEWGEQASKTAFAWRMTRDPVLLERARKMLEVSVAAYHDAYNNRRAVHWYSRSRILALAAYDWIYEGLTEEQRKAIIVPLVQHVDDVQPGPGKPHIHRRNHGGVTAGFYGVDSLLWFSGLAAYGDGFCDDLAQRHLNQGYDLYMQVMKFRDEGAGDDGGLVSAVPAYSMEAYPWAHFIFMHSYESACGRRIAQEWPGLALFPNWIFWNWIPADDSPQRPFHFGFGDCQHEQNRLPLDKIYEHLTQYMYFYKDANPELARLAATLRELAPNRSIGQYWPMLPFILTSVDDVEPFPLESLVNMKLKARHFETMGQFILRSGWTDHDTFCLFTAGASIAAHKHYDENNFVIYKNGFLALDSGTRGKETDYNLKYYFSQSVAHNCILVHKPNEPLPSYWGPSCDAPEGKTNYGGMGGGSATVLAFHTDDALTYIASDATKCYGEKCTEAIRQFVFLQPDYFIVYDRVGAAEAAYAKQWLLHTVEEPQISGHVMTVDQWHGRLFCETLLPTDGVLTTVGGPGREFWSNGKNWELDSKFTDILHNIEAKTGRRTLLGNWRLEVTPAVAQKNDRFLHVMTVGGQDMATPVPATLVQTATEDGVELALPSGVVRVMFRRDGDVGATVVSQRNGQTRNLLLPNVIQSQAGVLLE